MLTDELAFNEKDYEECHKFNKKIDRYQKDTIRKLRNENYKLVQEQQQQKAQSSEIKQNTTSGIKRRRVAPDENSPTESRVLRPRNTTVGPVQSVSVESSRKLFQPIKPRQKVTSKKNANRKVYFR